MREVSTDDVPKKAWKRKVLERQYPNTPSNHPNVGIYGIHGVFGILKKPIKIILFRCIQHCIQQNIVFSLCT